MLFRQLFDSQTSTYTYLIADSKTGEAILVDTVLEQVQRDYQLIQQLRLTLKYCLDTHIHADHITGSGQLRQLTNCKIVVPHKANLDCADYLLQDQKILQIGTVQIKAIASPGHTNCHFAYLVNDTHLLTGDALLIRGCGRTDFQHGDAGTLYDSITERFFNLPEETLVYPGHDYKGYSVSTIGEEKQFNPRLAHKNRAEFIEIMNNLNLPEPAKMKEAVPANQKCGQISHL